MDNVEINLMEGTYYLNQPIVFTPEDSRKEDETLTIKNFEDQKATISGGVPLKSEMDIPPKWNLACKRESKSNF
jgi:hypothetical protein